MSLGTEVGLGPDDIVLDGEPAPPPQKGNSAPSQFSNRLLWPNSWMHQGGTWHGGGPWFRPHCASLPKKAAEPAPIFGPFLLLPNGWMCLTVYCMHV